MEKRSLFNDAAYADIMARLENLSAESAALWGKMSVGQMLAHCADVQDIGNGKPLYTTNFFVRLLKGVIKKTVLSEKPYPRNSRTHPQFLITEPAAFDEEKSRLISAMETFRANGAPADGHPLFGKMDDDEWGWMYYKHMNHHFEQFGV